MTPSNGNIFRVTGPLSGEFTGPGEVPTQRPGRRSFDVFFDLRLNKRLSKEPWAWWFETPSWSLWRHCNETNATKVNCWLSETMRRPRIHMRKEIGGLTISQALFNRVYWMFLMRNTRNVIYLRYAVIAIKSPRCFCLVIDACWCPSGTRASGTITTT